MSHKHTMMIGLVILIGLMAGGLSGCGALKNVSVVGAKEAEKMAKEIAEFDLPAGYQAEYGAQLAGISLAAYHTADPNTHLFLAQAGPDSDLSSEDLQKAIANQQFEDARGKKKDRADRLKLVSREERTVRGKPAILLINEGTNSSDQPYREATLLFEGQNGPALASIAAPIAAWDEEAAQSFFTSIR